MLSHDNRSNMYESLRQTDVRYSPRDESHRWEVYSPNFLCDDIQRSRWIVDVIVGILTRCPTRLLWNNEPVSIYHYFDKTAFKDENFLFTNLRLPRISSSSNPQK